MRQLKLFYATRQAEERRRRRHRLGDTNAALAGGKAAKKLDKALEG